MRMFHPARLLAAPFLILALAACDGGGFSGGMASMSQSVGSNDYHRELRAREGARRGGVPYSVPPETASTQSAPPSGALPMGALPSASSQPLPVSPMPVSPMPGTQVTGATTSVPQVFVPQPPATPVATAPAQGLPTALPAGVAPQTFTPIPFGSRPVGAEIAPQSTAEIVTVTSVPTGSATSGPNVMAYALQTRHAVGTSMHRRSNPFRWSRWESACLQFVNQDAAQEAFLAAGGPERDPQHLDPDGDGFACWWDPQVYRQAVALGG